MANKCVDDETSSGEVSIKNRLYSNEPPRHFRSHSQTASPDGAFTHRHLIGGMLYPTAIAQKTIFFFTARGSLYYFLGYDLRHSFMYYRIFTFSDRRL
jgi:hypothetical protein